MFGRFWFDGDFSVRNLGASVELRQYQSFSKRNYFPFFDRMVLFLSSLGLFFFKFFHQGLFSAFDFPMSKDFSISKELPRVNCAKCAL